MELAHIREILNRHRRLLFAVLIFGILILGGFFRLRNISGYMTFLGDEGRDVLIVKRMIVDHDITFLGPTASVGGFFLGPIYYYFMVPFLWFWNLDPVGPAVMVALFGVATIYLVYRVGADFVSRFAGFIAALLYAIAPLIVAHSRSSWNPNIVPFFSLLYIYSLWKTQESRKIRWLIIAGMSFGVGVQLHYLFLFMLPVSLIYLYLYREKMLFTKLRAFVMGAVLPLIPFIGFEVKNKFPNTQTIWRYVTTEGDVGLSLSGSISTMKDVLFRSFARVLFNFPPPEQFYKYEDWIIIVWKTSIWLVVAISIFMLLRYIRIQRSKPHLLMLLWLVFGLGLFMLYQENIYDYYFVLVFPLLFLLVANLLVMFWQKLLLRPIVVIVLTLLIWVNWIGRPFQFPPNNQFDQVSMISRSIFNHADGKPFNFALITGGNSEHAYRYLFEIWRNPSVTIEFNEVDPERKTVTDQLYVLCETLPCEPLGHPLWEIAGFGRAQIDTSWKVSFLEVYRLVSYQGEDFATKDNVR